MTIAQLIQSYTKLLRSVSDTPRLDVELLIAHTCNRPRHFLYAYPEYILSSDLTKLLMTFIDRRQQGEPMAYILEQQEFWSLNLIVSKDTLIPRPETEHLVQWALDYLPNDPITLAELGTGSGAIALALAHERPAWHIHATDASLAALTIAIKNSQQHQLTNIEFYAGDWCDALPNHHYAAIISNPPYIADDDPHLHELRFEPRTALCAKEHGLHHFKIIIEQAMQYLQPNGVIILEHGYNQATVLTEYLLAAGFQHVQSHSDLAKKTRFVTGVL